MVFGQIAIAGGKIAIWPPNLWAQAANKECVLAVGDRHPKFRILRIVMLETSLLR
jgi:hypothetical protein